MPKRFVILVMLFLNPVARASFVESLWGSPVVQKLATAVDATRESAIEIYDLNGVVLEQVVIKTGDRVRFLLLDGESLAYMKESRKRVQRLKPQLGARAGEEKVVDTFLSLSLELATSFDGIIGKDLSFLQLKWLARGLDVIGEERSTYFVPRILLFSASRKAEDGQWRPISCGLQLAEGFGAKSFRR